MAGVAGQHRAAARLRHVPDEEARPTVERRDVVRESLEIVDQPRRPPVSVPREPHDLPMRAVQRQGLAAGKASLRVTADRLRRLIRRQARLAEEDLGRRDQVRVGPSGGCPDKPESREQQSECSNHPTPLIPRPVRS